jgi:hypothetical protein
MAIVNQVTKKIRMNLWDIVKFQISMHCNFNKISVSDLDLNCLTLLALSGEKEITDFCMIATKQKIFSSDQSVRNSLTKNEKKNLITKINKNRKRIKLNPDMNIQTSGNILLNYKCIRVDTEKEQTNS